MKVTIVLALMTIISGLLRFVQEFRSTQAAEKLKAMVNTTATVSRRDNYFEREKRKEIPIKYLVPGDIIYLSAGDMVPADVRVLGAKDLFVSQAVLTGESLPVEKHAMQDSLVEKLAIGYSRSHSSDPLEITTICFMGTNVVSGTAVAVVVATGNQTYFGSLAKKVVGKRAITSFDKGVNGVSWLLIGFMAVMVPIVFLINGITKEDWVAAFFFGISVAVGLTPEMLPMIVTANLARGAIAMSKEKAIVKRLNAIYNIGTMDVLCTDKTGTLTQNKIILERHLDIHGLPSTEALKYGYLAFLDPPKETACRAIAALEQHGVQVKVITGDNDIVTRKICKEVGLVVHHTVLGSEVELLSDEQLADIVDTTTVFAKMSLVQKARVIRILKRKGHTVGYLGDGINDAPALRDADVGISVDTAVDIAKESADIILLEKSLLVLEQGVVEGRKTFGNIIKYLKMTASSNFGNVFSVMGASVLLPFLPMMPIHLLVQNLLYDISQITIPFDNVDEEYLAKPQKLTVSDIGRFTIFIGPISSIFDYATYGLMWFVFGANSLAEASLFQSGWFIEGLLSQILIVHMIRTAKIPLFQSTAALSVMLLTGMVMAIGILTPFTQFGASIGLLPLPRSYFPWLVLILLCYCFLMQFIKVWYIRSFGKWL